MTRILSSARLQLREIEDSDAAFLLQLLNTRDFINNIGDRGVRTLDESRHYIESNIRASYRQHGMGLWVVEDRNSLAVLGLCGLLKRDTLQHPDVGYAFLPKFWSQGYAIEAASAVMIYGKETLGIKRIVAITAPDNDASIRVLNKLGLTFAKMVKLPGAARESRLFTPEIE